MHFEPVQALGGAPTLEYEASYSKLSTLNKQIVRRMLIHKSQRVQVDEEDEFYSQDLVGLTVLLSPYHAAADAAVAKGSEAAGPSDSQARSESDSASEADADGDAESSDPVATQSIDMEEGSAVPVRETHDTSASFSGEAQPGDEAKQGAHTTNDSNGCIENGSIEAGVATDLLCYSFALFSTVGACVRFE